MKLDDQTIALICDAIRGPPGDTRFAGISAAASFGYRGEVFKEAIRPYIKRIKLDPLHQLAATTWVSTGGDRDSVTLGLLPLLERATDDRENSTLIPALDCLARNGSGIPAAVAHIKRLMNWTDPGVKSAAALAFARLGGDSSTATRALLEAFIAEERSYKDGRPNYCAARTHLYMFSNLGLWHIPTLASWLENDNPIQRGEAAHQLGKCGARASSVLPRLRELRHDPDQRVAEMAAEAIKRIEWEIQHPKEAAELHERAKDSW